MNLMAADSTFNHRTNNLIFNETLTLMDYNFCKLCFMAYPNDWTLMVPWN